MEKLMNLKMKMAMEVRFEEAPMSPRDDCNFGEFYLWNSNIISPDVNDYSSAEDFRNAMLGENAMDSIMDHVTSNKEFNVKVFDEFIKRGVLTFPVCVAVGNDNRYVVHNRDDMPGYAADGYIFVSQEDAVGHDNPADTPLSKEIIDQAFGWLKAEVASYQAWANGYVYEVVLTSLLGDYVGSTCNLYEDDQEFAFSAIRDLYNIGENEDWEDYDSMAIAHHFGMIPETP